MAADKNALLSVKAVEALEAYSAWREQSSFLSPAMKDKVNSLVKVLQSPEYGNDFGDSKTKKFLSDQSTDLVQTGHLARMLKGLSETGEIPADLQKTFGVSNKKPPTPSALSDVPTPATQRAPSPRR